MTEQQSQALAYFNTHAGEWREKAAGTDTRAVNIIAQRNGVVLDVIRARPHTRTLLDVGCGTGELVTAAAELGVESLGVDFAPEMIERATHLAQQEAVTQRARFICGSIFEADLGSAQFDVISANGFIEYISLEHLNQFLDLVARRLAPSGSFVVGSRNRLYNVVSLNAFTQAELMDDTLVPLIGEAMAWASGKELGTLRELDLAPLQTPTQKHPETGVQVETRFQFTPLQLARMVRERGLTPRQVYPIHIHCASRTFKERHPEVHASVSSLLQTYTSSDSSLIPYASSFMLHASRED